LLQGSKPPVRDYRSTLRNSRTLVKQGDT